MRGAPEEIHPEDSFPRTALFGVEGGDGRWRGAGVVPQLHRRDVEQVREEHAFDAEMAEEDDGIRVGVLDPVEVSLPDVAVIREDFVERITDRVVFFPDVFTLHDTGFGPRGGRIVFGNVHPVLRNPVPGLREFVRPVGFSDKGAKFVEPVARRAGTVFAFKRQRRGVLGPPERRAVGGVDGKARKIVRQEFGLPPALLRQGVVFLVRIGVPDDQDSQDDASDISFKN